MLAWIRTGIALMAFGFAIARFGLFLREVAAVGRLAMRAPRGVGSAWLGVALVALGMTTNAAATVRYARVRAAIARGDVGAPDGAMVYAIGALLTIVGLAMTALLARTLSE